MFLSQQNLETLCTLYYSRYSKKLYIQIYHITPDPLLNILQNHTAQNSCCLLRQLDFWGIYLFYFLDLH